MVAPEKPPSSSPQQPQTLPQPTGPQPYAAHSPLDRAKTLAKRIPGLRALYHRVILGFDALARPRGIASWLYGHDVVWWVYRDDLYRQLPPAFQRFARFCKWQRSWSCGRIIAGERTFRRAIERHKASGGPDHVLINLGAYKLALNLLDPRMLQAPNELLDPTGDATLLARYIGPGDTFIDIGANHGSFSILAAAIVGPTGRVVAVEPQPRLGDLLELSLEANAHAPYQVLRMACGDADGSIDLFIPTETSGRAGVFAAYSAEGRHQRVTVPLRRFDDAVDWQNFRGKAFVKLDIEGSEVAFLRGARRMIAQHRPTILLEINPTSQAAAGSSVAQLRDLLIELGYHHFIPAESLASSGARAALTELADRHVGNILIVD